MDRNQKQEFVTSLKNELENANTVIVSHYIGLTVDEITGLRKKTRELGAVFKVTKNSLTKLALADTKYSQIADLFSGPTAITYSEDPVAAAKAVVEFAKDNEKLKILGGAIDDKRAELSEIQTLAKLPSLDELRAKIVGMLNTPATRIAGVVQAPAGQIARVVSAHSQQG